MEPAEDVVVDDSEISILLSELREEKRHILVVENHLETSEIGWHYVDEDARVDLNGLQTDIARHLHLIPTTEERHVTIALGCFEKGVMFQGFRKGTTEEGLNTYKGPQYRFAEMT